MRCGAKPLDRRHVRRSLFGNHPSYVFCYHVGRNVERACFRVRHSTANGVTQCEDCYSDACRHVRAVQDFIAHYGVRGERQ